MWPESDDNKTTLKSGLSTGCCATACAIAAANCLLNDQKKQHVSVTLPKGKIVELTISAYQVLDAAQRKVRTSTIKDAGDDPDITHGARVFVEMSLRAEAGVHFSAAEGVGTVTREGLVLAVGEPAINPVPRKMITEHLQAIATASHYSGGFEVAVGVDDGQNLALKTMNPRLGILGGLSILGTTGIVRPFSCSAYIASIHQGIDVARANGIQHIAATTGSSSEAAIKTVYPLPDMALIEMGDFVGAVLKYLRKQSIPKLSLCGGFGKITKLAEGHLDLHSRASTINFEFLAAVAEQAGASTSLLDEIFKANTSVQVYKLCLDEDSRLGHRFSQLICLKALEKARSVVAGASEIEVYAINRQGQIIAHVDASTEASLL